MSTFPADLLARSWAAHERAKERRSKHAFVRQGVIGPVVAGDKSEQMAEWAEAYRLRKEAHAADPEHLDGAWAAEDAKTAVGTHTHDAMMAFYRDKLGS